jgi:hypothetical protein
VLAEMRHLFGTQLETDAPLALAIEERRAIAIDDDSALGDGAGETDRARADAAPPIGKGLFVMSHYVFGRD